MLDCPNLLDQSLKLSPLYKLSHAEYPILAHTRSLNFTQIEGGIQTSLRKWAIILCDISLFFFFPVNLNSPLYSLPWWLLRNVVGEVKNAQSRGVWLLTNLLLLKWWQFSWSSHSCKCIERKNWKCMCVFPGHPSFHWMAPYQLGLEWTFGLKFCSCTLFHQDIAS